MNKTKIEWCHYTINPIIGCSKISEGCQNCYAARMAKRLAENPATPQYKEVADWNGKLAFVPSVLKYIPGKGKKVFVCSMSDMFHENVRDEWLQKIFEYVKENKQHTFLILTKRPQNAVRWFLKNESYQNLPNLWFGVTCENQRTVDERIPLLLEIPTRIRFVSCEPLLEEIKLPSVDFHCDLCGGTGILAYFPKGKCYICHGKGYIPAISTDTQYGKLSTPARHVDWVIVGAETGHNRRIMEQKWAEKIYYQCKRADVPFFGKKDSNGKALAFNHFVVREFPNE